jgi:hypothetical protein
MKNIMIVGRIQSRRITTMVVSDKRVVGHSRPLQHPSITEKELTIIEQQKPWSLHDDDMWIMASLVSKRK